MKQAVAIPVTVKCRIGIDDQDPEVALDALAQAVVAAGTDALIVHARKAWLNGLSPKENRDIPPLDYDRVYRLKASMPDVPIIINGGIGSLAEARAHLAHVDGVMLGRAAYQEPWRLLNVDPELFGEAAPFAAMKDALRGDDAVYRTRARALARGCIRSRGISSARFTACPARGHSAVISPKRGQAAGAVCASRLLRAAVALVGDRAASSDCGLTDLRIAAQLQAVGPHFPAFQPIEKTHAQQVGFHLPVRHHQRRHRAFDQLADGEPIERQPRRLGVAARGLEVDVIFEQFERKAGRLRRFIGQDDGSRAGVDHHRGSHAVDLRLQREFAGLPAGDLHRACRHARVRSRSETVLLARAIRVGSP